MCYEDDIVQTMGIGEKAGSLVGGVDGALGGAVFANEAGAVVFGGFGA